MEAAPTVQIQGLEYLTLYVVDLQRSLAFYEALGLKVIHSSPHFAMLTVGNTRLGLHQGGGGKKSRTVNIHFRVGDVNAAHEALQEGGFEFVEPPKNQSWGVRSASLDDPDGYRIEIVTPL